jgi:anti-anti-sigma regulatory factor
LKIKTIVDNRGDLSAVTLIGEMTEETDFRPLVNEIRGDRVEVNLEGITRINSCGVREWINFVNALERDGKAVLLERCAPVVVTQMTHLTNFAGSRGTIGSAMAPYFCPSCESEEKMLVTLGKQQPELPEERPCPACGETMELAEAAELYQALGRRRG